MLPLCKIYVRVHQVWTDHFFTNIATCLGNWLFNACYTAGTFKLWNNKIWNSRVYLLWRNCPATYIHLAHMYRCSIHCYLFLTIFQNRILRQNTIATDVPDCRKPVVHVEYFLRQTLETWEQDYILPYFASIRGPFLILPMICTYIYPSSMLVKQLHMLPNFTSISAAFLWDSQWFTHIYSRHHASDASDLLLASWLWSLANVQVWSNIWWLFISYNIVLHQILTFFRFTWWLVF